MFVVPYVVPWFTLAEQVLQIVNCVSSSITVKNFHTTNMFMLARGCECLRCWNVSAVFMTYGPFIGLFLGIGRPDAMLF